MKTRCDLRSFAATSPGTCRGGQRGEQVLVRLMPFETWLALAIFAGQRTSIGTRTPPPRWWPSRRGTAWCRRRHQETIGPLSAV